MPKGGRITIEVADQTIDAKPMALISVRDTGHGIASSIRDRIFEPFFTTKPVDKGSGLGLSQVYGFVQQSNGKIDVASKVGAGTTFNILLQISEDNVVADRMMKAEDRLIISSPSVLVVEDNVDVTIVAVDYLEHVNAKWSTGVPPKR
jgi:two-component system NtrC family sensor kinase